MKETEAHSKPSLVPVKILSLSFFLIDGGEGFCLCCANSDNEFNMIFIAYLTFVMNVVNAVRVIFLAQCKKIPEEPEKYCFWQFCRKFTHFPSVKFS